MKRCKNDNDKNGVNEKLKFLPGAARNIYISRICFSSKTDEHV